MPETTSLIAFIAAALIVLVIPGPGVLYVVTRSLAQGHRAGLVSVLGLSTGALLHVAAATAGLSVILLASAAAFNVVKWLGAGYLIYLGIRALTSRRRPPGLDAPEPCSLYRVFADGVVISVFNPKIALFFLAFLPQFVTPAEGVRQLMLLGLLYVALALCTDGAYALLAGGLRGLLRGRLMQGPWPQYASGCVYLGLGVGLALADRRN